jgi:hypothetical protein
MGLTSSTLRSKACRSGVVVEAVEEAWQVVSLNRTGGRLMLTIPAYDDVYLISICHERVCVKAGVSSTAPAKKVVGGINSGRRECAVSASFEKKLARLKLALVLFSLSSQPRDNLISTTT